MVDLTRLFYGASEEQPVLLLARFKPSFLCHPCRKVFPAKYFCIPCPLTQAIQHPSGRNGFATSVIAATTAASGDIASSSDFTDALFGEQQEPAVSERMKACHCAFRVARRAMHDGVSSLCFGHCLFGLVDESKA